MRAFGFRLLIQFPAALFHSRIRILLAEDEASLSVFLDNYFSSVFFSFQAALGTRQGTVDGGHRHLLVKPGRSSRVGLRGTQSSIGLSVPAHEYVLGRWAAMGMGMGSLRDV